MLSRTHSATGTLKSPGKSVPEPTTPGRDRAGVFAEQLFTSTVAVGLPSPYPSSTGLGSAPRTVNASERRARTINETFATAYPSRLPSPSKTRRDAYERTPRSSTGPIATRYRRAPKRGSSKAVGEEVSPLCAQPTCFATPTPDAAAPREQARI